MEDFWATASLSICKTERRTGVLNKKEPTFPLYSLWQDEADAKHPVPKLVVGFDTTNIVLAGNKNGMKELKDDNEEKNRRIKLEKRRIHVPEGRREKNRLSEAVVGESECAPAFLSHQDPAQFYTRHASRSFSLYLSCYLLRSSTP